MQGWLVDVEPPPPALAPNQEVTVLAIGADRVVPEARLSRACDPARSARTRRCLGDGHCAMPSRWTAPARAAWLAAAPAHRRDPGMHCLLAELDGRPAAAAGLYTPRTHRWPLPGAVLPGSAAVASTPRSSPPARAAPRR